MTPRWKLFSVVVITAIILSFPMAGCVPASGEPAMDTVSSMETLQAALTQTAQAIQQSNSPSRTITWTPTFTLTPELLPTLTDTLEPTPTGLEQIPTESIVFSSFIPQGARARLGRGKINQVAVSPDGKTLAVAGATGLSLFNAETFEEILYVPTSQALSGIAFTSDGKEIVSITDCCAVLIDCSRGCPDPWQCLESRWILTWSAADGRLLRTIALEDPFDQMIVIPGGKTIAVWYSENNDMYHGFFEVDILDISNGNTLFTISDEIVGSLFSLTVSPDGKILAGGFDGHIVLWNTENGKRIRLLEGPEDFLNESIFISQNGKILVSSNGKKIVVWDLVSGLLQRNWEAKKMIRNLALSPDGNILIAVTGGGYMQSSFQWNSWDVKSGNLLRSSEEPMETILSIKFFPDGKTLIVGKGHAIQIRDGLTGQVLRTMTDPFSKWSGVGFFTEGKEIAFPVDSRVVFYDAERMDWIGEIQYPEGAAFSPDYRMYAFPTSGNEIAVVDTKTGTRLHSLRKPAYFDDESGIYLALDGKTIAVTHYVRGDDTTYGDPIDLQIDIWDLVTGKLLHSLSIQTQENLGWGLEFSSDFTKVANTLGGWGDFIERVELYNLHSGQELGHFYVDSDDNSFTLSYDGKRYSGDCTEESDYDVNFHTIFCIYDTESGEVLINLAASTYACEEESELCIYTQSYDEESGEYPINLTASTFGKGIAAAKFSPDGKLIAFGSWDGFIGVWKTDSGELLYTFKGHNGSVDNLSFSADDTMLVSTGDGTVVLWDLSS